MAEGNQSDLESAGGDFYRYPGRSRTSSAEGSITCERDAADYPMCENGICYIFNHKKFELKDGRNLKDRSGTDVDANLLKEFFLSLGFEVHSFQDLTVLEVKIEIGEARKRIKKGKYSCFVCCILSYEGEQGKVYAKDDSYSLSTHIFEQFYGNKCPSLAGKPKIFFIQAGKNKLDPKPSTESTDNDHKQSFEIHTVADFLIVQSSVPGSYSWDSSQHTLKGSWFIEALYQTLQRHFTNLELLELLQIVNRKVLYEYRNFFESTGLKLKVRLPSITSTLTRNIKFKGSSKKGPDSGNTPILENGFLYDSANYCMNEKGKVYIFNHKEFKSRKRKKYPDRPSTDCDAEILKEMFKNLHFEIKEFKDAKRKTIKTELKKVALQSSEGYSCFICCVLTHGKDGRLVAFDEDYDINEIFSPFHGKWVGKPKIYFIQACRGDSLNPGIKVFYSQVDSNSEESESSSDSEECESSQDKKTFIPFVHPDFLMSYSTVSGDVSFKSEKHESWFIKILCETVKKHVKDMNLLQILTIVHRNVAIEKKSHCKIKKRHGKKQVPCLTSTLTKNVKLDI